MRKLALGFSFAVVAGFLVAATYPVENIIVGQVQCGSGRCIGDGTTELRLKSPTIIDARGSAVADGGNMLVYTCHGAYLGYDMPALKGPLVALNTSNADTPSITCKGALFGDTCSVGLDQVPVNGSTIFNAKVTAADTVVVTESCFTTDAGTCDQPDASYSVRCIR